MHRRHLLRLGGGTVGTALVGALAGCNQLTSQRFEATPAGLTEANAGSLGFTSGGLESVTKTFEPEVGGASATVHVVSHLANYRVDGGVSKAAPNDGGETVGDGTQNGETGASSGSEPTDHAGPWSVPDPSARGVGVLSTPTATVSGQEVNPLATESLDGLLELGTGNDLVSRAGDFDTDGASWARQPERVGTTSATLLETETTVESYAGLLTTESDPPRSVVIHLARVSDDDVVIAAYVQWRTTSLEDDEADWGKRVEAIRNSMDRLHETVTEITENVEYEPGVNGRIELDVPKIEVNGLRLVQRCTDGVVMDREEDYRGNLQTKIKHSEPDPPTVVGDNATAMFDVSTQKFSKLEEEYSLDQDSLDVEVSRDYGSRVESDSFQIPLYDLASSSYGGYQDVDTDTNQMIQVLNAIATDDALTDPPVFTVESDLRSVTVSIDHPAIVGDSQTIQPGAGIELRSVRPLRLGFVEVIDPTGGSKFGGSNGRVDEYEAVAAASVDYLDRVYPGSVTAYRYDDALDGTSGESITYTLAYMDTQLTATSSVQSLTKQGSLIRAASPRTQALDGLRNEGFDVVVGVVPEGFYQHHGSGGAAGLAPWDKTKCVSVRHPTSTSQAPRVAAQEIGHRLAWHDPYEGPTPCHPTSARDAGYVDKKLDAKGCRDETADHDHARYFGTTDEFRFTSLGLHLYEGSFEVVGSWGRNGRTVDVNPETLSSQGGEYAWWANTYMDYGNPADGRIWSDPRIERTFVEKTYDVFGRDSGGDDTQGSTMGVGGSFSEGIQVEYLRAYDGVSVDPPELSEEDPGATLTFLDPEETALHSVTAPTVPEATHGQVSGNSLSVATDFPDRATTLRVEYRDRDRELNAITAPIRNAVDRVPDRGLAADPRDEIQEGLAAVEDAMADRDFETAGERLRERVRRVVSERLGSYETHAAEPDRAQLLATIDRMAGRLDSLA